MDQTAGLIFKQPTTDTAITRPRARFVQEAMTWAMALTTAERREGVLVI